jgi:hypothetical protein
MNMDEVQAAIAEAYLKLSVKSQDWVRLAKLRPLVPRRYCHTDVTAALIVMISDMRGHVYLVPESNRKVMTQIDHDAAVYIGGEGLHLLAIENEWFEGTPYSPWVDPNRTTETAPAQELPEYSDGPTMTDQQVEKINAIHSETTAGGGMLTAHLGEDGAVYAVETYTTVKTDENGMNYTDYEEIRFVVEPDGSVIT